MTNSIVTTDVGHDSDLQVGDHVLVQTVSANGRKPKVVPCKILEIFRETDRSLTRPRPTQLHVSNLHNSPKKGAKINEWIEPSLVRLDHDFYLARREQTENAARESGKLEPGTPVRLRTDITTMRYIGLVPSYVVEKLWNSNYVVVGRKADGSFSKPWEVKSGDFERDSTRESMDSTLLQAEVLRQQTEARYQFSKDAHFSFSRALRTESTAVCQLYIERGDVDILRDEQAASYLNTAIVEKDVEKFEMLIAAGILANPYAQHYCDRLQEGIVNAGWLQDERAAIIAILESASEKSKGERPNFRLQPKRDEPPVS
jgi:hypothetical protein